MEFVITFPDHHDPVHRRVRNVDDHDPAGDDGTHARSGGAYPAAGQRSDGDAADIRTAICDNTSLLPDCDTLLTIDLREIDRATYATRHQEMCIERADATATVSNTFNPGRTTG
jgi:hypothetical protein